MEKAIFKYNGGLGALLCSKCRVIIKTGKDFTEEEIMAIKGKIDMPPQYCNKCKNKLCQEEDLTTTSTK
jgi:hypothetical protein